VGKDIAEIAFQDGNTIFKRVSFAVVGVVMPAQVGAGVLFEYIQLAVQPD
jgi:hypothetical protein